MLYLLHILAALRCSLYLSFTYIVASTPRESRRQPAILFITLFVIIIKFEFASYSCNFALFLISTNVTDFKRFQQQLFINYITDQLGESSEKKFAEFDTI